MTNWGEFGLPLIVNIKGAKHNSQTAAHLENLSFSKAVPQPIENLIRPGLEQLWDFSPESFENEK